MRLVCALAVGELTTFTRGGDYMINFGSWLNVAGWAIGLVLSAIAVLVSTWAGLWLLRKLISPSEYPALTMLLAIVGGLLALYQANLSYRERQQQQARSLQYVVDTTERMMFLVAFQEPRTDQIDLRSVPVDMLARTASRVSVYADALDKVDTASLASAAAMGALLRARAASADLSGAYRVALANSQPANVDVLLPNLGKALEDLRAERDRLYPAYKAGSLIFGTLPQQR